MIALQIITHGKLASGLLDSARMIAGCVDEVSINELSSDQSVEGFQKEVLETTNKLLEVNESVLIFVDLFGATPFNTSVLNSEFVDTDRFKVISGVNLPILLETIYNRTSMTLAELYNHILEIKQDSIIGWEGQ